MGRGGTRSGAGRPGHRLTSESSHRIDIRRWHKRGYLEAGGSFNWQWTCNDQPSGNIGVTSMGDALRLRYAVGGAGQWRDASQTVYITFTQCHYGGSRPWFTCPVCRDRAAVLFLRSGRFACRRCQKVSYRSQSGSAADRGRSTAR